MTSKKPMMLLFVSYGVLLQITGGMLAGMGEGPAVEGAVFGSPFTLVPVVPFIFPTWVVIGYLLEKNRVKAVERWLLSHYVFAPFAIYAQLAPGGFWRNWDRFLGMTMAEPAVTLLLIAPYVIGQVITWRTVRRMKREGSALYDGTSS
jgi:hypothetical protein